MGVNNVVAILLLLVLMVTPTVAGGDFDSFKTAQGKKYANYVEEAYRKKIFKDNVDVIEAHNSNSDRAYTMGVNQFSDLTNDEFRSKFYLIQRCT